MPNVRLQVLPFRAGGHAAAAAPSPSCASAPGAADLVYIEQLTSALYLKRDDGDFDAVNRLYVDAAPLARTVEILERIARET